MNQQILRRTFYCISVPDMVLSFVLPLYCVGLGFSPLETTGLFSVVSLSLLASKFFIGGLCDKVGRKRVFCAGAELQATTYAVLAFSQSAAPLYLSQILNGLSISLLSVALYAMLSDDRKQNFAAQQGKISGSGGQGQLLGVLIYWGMTAFMKFRMSWRYFLLVSAALCAYGAVTAGRNLQETKPVEQPAKVKISGVLKKLFSVNVLLSLGTSVVGVILVLYLNQAYSLSLGTMGIVLLVPAALLVYATPAIGKAVEKHGERRAFFVGAAGAAASLCAMARWRSLRVFVACWTLYNVFEKLLVLSLDSMVSQRATEKIRGKISGIYQASSSLGGFIGALASGAAFQAISTAAPLYLATAIFAVVLIALAAVSHGADFTEAAEAVKSNLARESK